MLRGALTYDKCRKKESNAKEKWQKRTLRDESAAADKEIKRTTLIYNSSDDTFYGWVELKSIVLGDLGTDGAGDGRALKPSIRTSNI